MRMVSRLVHVPANGQAAVIARVARLSRERSVLVVACRRPLAILKRQYEDGDVDLRHVFILDVATDYLSAEAADPEHEAYIHNPAMLETIAKRARMIADAKAERKVTVMVDDAASFLLHVPRSALLEALRYATQHLAARGSEQEYLTPAGFADDPLVDNARGIVDEEVSLAPDGSLGPWPISGAWEEATTRGR